MEVKVNDVKKKIACTYLDSVGVFHHSNTLCDCEVIKVIQSLQKQRDIAVEALNNMPCDYVAIETTTGVTSVHAEYCNKCKALKKDRGNKR